MMIFVLFVFFFYTRSFYKKYILVTEYKQLLESQKVLNDIQERFLNKFSRHIYNKNLNIIKIIENNKKNLKENENYNKFVVSSLELKNYLFEIEQFAQTEKSHLPSYEEIDARVLTKKIICHFEKDIEKKNLQIELKIPNNLFFWTDIILFEPILFNFISNAIKYSFQNGRIVLVAKQISKRYGFFLVQDFGPGISQIYHKKIFEKFYRVQDDYVYKVKGSGLGLYFSRYFAEKLGLRILLESQLGEGSSFKIYVKIKQ
jgi:signal transduction histidine kinase